MKEITSFLAANSSLWDLRSNFSRLLFSLAFIVMGFNVNAQAPPNVTDGLPDGWPTVMTNYPYPYGSYVVDLQNDSNDDIWTEGSADVDDIGDWTTTTGTSNDKNDLKNTGAVTIYDPISLSNIIYFFADRYSNKGDSQLGYWLLQGPVQRTADGFVGGHQDGDILLRTNFKNGGSTAVREVFIWLNGQLQEIDLPTTSLNFTSNAETIGVPNAWSFDPKFGDSNTYPPNSFVEGFLNLTELESAIADTFEFDFDPCFSYFLISTGQSQSETASLADLVSGQYGSKPGAQELIGSTVCSADAETGSVSLEDFEINITYQIQQLDGEQYVNVPGQDPIHGSEVENVQFNGLTAGEYYVNAYIGNSQCETRSGPVSVNINVIDGGAAGSPQTICSGENAEELSVTGASGDGTMSYQWQYSTDGSNFTDIDSNANGATYDPGSHNTDTWYLRITTFTLNQVECSDASSAVKITVNNVDGGMIENAQTICEGETPNQLGFVSGSEADGDGAETYQWEYSDTGENDDFNPVPSNGNSATYAPGSLNSDTWFRVVTISKLDNVDCSAISDKIKITVNNVVGGMIENAQTICAGEAPESLSFVSGSEADGDGAETYQWEYSDTGENDDFNPVPSNGNSATYSPGSLDSDTWYRVVTTSTIDEVGCNAISNKIKITVNNLDGGEIESAQTICAGESPETLGFVSGSEADGDGTETYQWEYSETGENDDFGPVPSGGNAATYSPGSLDADTWYRVVTTSTLSDNECSAISNKIKITVNNVDGGMIEAAQTICYGDTPKAIEFVSGSEADGDGDLTYQWEYSDTGEEDDFAQVPSNGSGEIYSPGALTADTWYRVVTTSKLNEVECIDISNKVAITVNELPIPLDADISICEDEKDSVLSEYDDDVLGDQVGTVVWYNGDPANNGEPIDSKNAFDLTQDNIDLFAVVILSSTKCEAAVDISLSINPLPEVQIVEAPSDVVCITDMVEPGQTDELGEPVQRQFKVKVNGEFWNSDDTNGVWSGDVDEDGTYDPTVHPDNPVKTITFTYTDQYSECVGEDTIRFTVEEPEISDPVENSICIADIPEGGINIRSEFLDPMENGDIVGEVSYEMNEEEFNGLLDPNALGVFSIFATYNLENKACTKTVNIVITVTDCLVCDTAFARPAGEDTSGDDSYCFINEVPPYGELSTDVLSSERWGWTNHIKLSDFTSENNFEQTFRLYAGAGQCDINNAENVGELSIVYNSAEDNVVVTYEIERVPDEVGYIFSGAHLYVGEEPYPTKKKGKTTEYTVAPGKYPFNTKGGMEPTYKIVYTIEDVLPEFYLIAHASACTSFTKEFMDDLWDKAEVEYVTLKNNNRSMITASGGNNNTKSNNLSSTSITKSSESLFSVSPVPFTRELNVQYLFDYTSDVNVEVYDLNGRLLRSYKASAVNSDVTSNFNVDFKTRSGKVYIIRMTTDREVFTSKIMSGK